MATNKVLAGVLAGIAIGSTIGFLFATDKGKKIRKNFSKYGQSYFSDIKDQFGDVIDNFAGSFFTKDSQVESKKHIHSPQQYAKKH